MVSPEIPKRFEDPQKGSLLHGLRESGYLHFCRSVHAQNRQYILQRDGSGLAQTQTGVAQIFIFTVHAAVIVKAVERRSKIMKISAETMRLQQFCRRSDFFGQIRQFFDQSQFLFFSKEAVFNFFKVRQCVALSFGLPQDTANAGVSVLNIENGVIGRFGFRQIEVKIHGAVGIPHHEEVTGGIVTDILDEVFQRYILAGAFGHTDKFAVLI